MKSIFESDKPESEKKVETPAPTPIKEKAKDPHQETRTVVLDQENAYLSDVIKAQPQTLEDIEVTLKERDDPNFHRLSLPPEIKKYEDKYTFRWIFKNRRAISEASQIRKWIFVNKSYFPDLPDHLFSTSGAIERGDNLLAFTLNHVAEAMRTKPIDASRNMVKSRIGAHKGNPNFYTPTDDGDGESTKVVGL